MSVVVAQSTVLLRLCPGSRVARAEVGPDDDVRHRRVGQWVAEALRDEVGARNGVVDVQERFLGVEVRNRGRRVGGVVEEDQRDVIRRDPRRGHTRVVHDQGWIGFAPQERVDGVLAVLGGDDDEGVLKVAVGPEIRDNLAQRVVDEVECFQDPRAEGGVVVVLDGLLSNGDRLEVAAHHVRHLAVYGTCLIDDIDPVDPVEPRIDVELVVWDCARQSIRRGSHFGEVACTEASV